jgi:cytidyltransferase-like protein
MTHSQKPLIVAVSGGFDPLHIGHVRLFAEAKALGNQLIVILNNDHWLRKKKGVIFMPEQERKELIAAIGVVDHVMLSMHPENPSDMSVCNELQQCRPDIFANGGDRQIDNIPETAVCQSLGCKMIFNIGQGGKIQSSSWLLKEYLSHQQSWSDK